MTEANLDLQPSWPSYVPVSRTGVLSSKFGEVCAQFQEQLYTYLATLGATSSVAEFDKVCTQFKEKPAVHLLR